MPYLFNKIQVVTYQELVPEFYTSAALDKALSRHKDNPYFINRVQRGGNGRPMLIELESLPGHIQQAMADRYIYNYQTLLSNYKSKSKQ